MLSISETAVTIMAASIPILRALSRDKVGPGGVKLFTLNVTQHVTVLQPENNNNADEHGQTSRRLFKLMRRGRRALVLSKIVETDELSPGLLGGLPTGERSFV